ncbi:MAG TPA: hypothetical protein VIG46_05955 [Candidatus Baltobacteraceae bacterium]
MLAAIALLGALQPGPHAVGFRVARIADYTRVWAVGERDYPRPIRISIWYPARTGGSAMAFSGYLRYNDGGAADRDSDALLERRDERAYRHGDFADDPAVFARLMAAPAGVLRDAPAAPGRYPIVLYAAGWNSLSPDNVVLATVLASRGFVVVTVPQLPAYAGQAELAVSRGDVDAQARDLAGALGYAQGLADADPSRIALIGYSMGAVAELTLASRRHVVATVGLDPSYAAIQWDAFVRGLPAFNPWGWRSPMLVLHSHVGADYDAQLLDDLLYQDRYVGLVAGSTHGDYSDYPSVMRAAGLSVDPAMSVRHDRIVACIVAFVAAASASSKFDASACDMPGLVVRPASGVPDTATLIADLHANGFEAMVARLDALAAAFPGRTIVDEAELNAAAYALLARNADADALTAFRINARYHPTSANAFDSLADGYAAVGDIANERAAFRTELALIPADPRLDDAARASLASRARHALDALPSPPAPAQDATPRPLSSRA